jgi:hypothetical protein
MRILATLQEPDEGSIHLGDTNVLSQKDEVRRMLGYLPQAFGVYPKVSAENLLNHFALLKGIAERWARKEVVDESGVETEVTMDDWVEAGVFAPAREGRELSALLYVQKHRIRSGEQTSTVAVPGRPIRVGIDPYHLLIDRDSADNIALVTAKE